ncbi:sperm flagellar protein 2-like isoform X8 [Bolinopsis microptera]|uniref:sperm flagellar protein 2-like isoform X8 n=2 Tax=Bolinopsis microptera TaxID=2820187 RepID=UPI003079BD13
MTDILCKWLNEDVKLADKIDPANFARAFGSGYLLGELMSKYGLQEDFKSFSPGNNTDAKLNNFSRLEPSLRLLQVPFNSNIVSDVMREKPGSVTKLMYQLFIALNRKEQQNLTSHAMEAMKSSQKMTLETANAEFYQNRLRQQFPRQVQVDMEELVKNFDKKRLDNLEKALKAERAEEEQSYKVMQHLRQQKMERSRQIMVEQRELIEKLGTSPKPRTKVFDQKVKETQELRRAQISKKIVKDTYRSLDEFEEKQSSASALRTGAMMNDFSSYIRGEGGPKDTQITLKDNRATVMRTEQNAEYISKIRMRLCDDALARKEREKRRRRVLVEQLAAHEAIEQAKHEDMLVTCLMRQSQLERRIALQLLQVRLEKDVIRNNRLQREQQYMQRRLKDFDEALNLEAEVARLTKQEYEEQCQKELARHEAIAAENQNAKYMKHFNMCRDTLMQIVDMSCIAGQYRNLSEQPIPVQMWRQWKALFVAGKPFYEDRAETPADIEEDSEAVTVLNECDMNQYKTLVGEWVPPDEHPEITPHMPLQNNYILGHILKRLTDIVYPPSNPPTPPQFPEFPIKACVVGKTFSGKTSVLQALSAKKRLQVLDIDILVNDAVAAFNNNETVEVTEIVEVGVAVPVPSQGEVAGEGGAPPEGEKKEEVVASEAAPPAEQAPPAETPQEDAVPGTVPSPVPTIQSVTKQVPSPRAVLGKAVEQAMGKGKSIPVQILIDIVVHGIREVPEGTGWILDNFPKTLKQAKALEKALSGFSGFESRASFLSTPLSGAKGSAAATPRNTPSPARGGRNGKKGKKNQLVEEPDCDKPTPLPPPISGIDVIVHLQVPDKIAIKRACGRRKHKNGEEYHEVNRPPPEGSYTGVPPSYDEFNVKHSPSPDTHPIEDDAYKQLQPRLVTYQEEWPKMEKWFGMFNNLVTVDAQQPLSNVEEKVEDHLNEVLEKKQKPPTPAPAPEEIPAPEEPIETPTKTEETPGEEGAEPATPPEGVPETIPEEPPKPPSPKPGSDEWAYVDEPIPHDAANILFPQWELVEDSYLKLCKHTFKKIREEREIIIRYFYSTKKNFVVFLQRPDNKQTFVTSWVKNYNSVAEDMREDMEMKAELHQTVEDLQERLWDISDKKKIEAEEEKQSIVTEQWLEDHIGLLTNHYIQLLQAEVDRYQGSVRLIRDYYQVSGKKILDEPRKEFTRVALVELPRTDTPRPPSEEKNERSSARSDRSKSAGKVQSSPSGATPGLPAVDSEESGEPEIQRRIPLVARKALERESRKSGRPPRETPDQDLEEAQIVEAYISALAVIEQLKQPSEEEAAAEAGKSSRQGKAKGKKEKPKKGKKSVSPAVTPTAGTPVPELTPEEIARLKMLERANLECTSALLAEDKALNLKLSVVKLRAINVIKDLKERASKMYDVQNDWIGQRFQKEMDSIKTMCLMLSDVIESEKSLLPQVILTDEKFEVDLSYKMFEPLVTPPPDEPIEMPTPNLFTIAQIQELHRNLKEVAPSGYISLDMLTEMFEPPSFLPEIWQNVTYQQLEELFSRHLCETKYINWRTVLLSCILPIPLPSQAQLISTAKQYRTIDKDNTGKIDMAGYAQGDLWFGNEDLMTPDGTAKFDRLGYLKITLFTLLCDENYKIEYTDFLLLFASDPEPGNGAMKALAVMTGDEVEWPTYIETPDPTKDFEQSSSHSTTGAVENMPVRGSPITLEQLLRVISFNRMPTRSLKLVQDEMTAVFKEVQGEDGTADVSTILVHPKSRDIILHTPSYLLVDYRTLLLEAISQDTKFAERVSQPLV